MEESTAAESQHKPLRPQNRENGNMVSKRIPPSPKPSVQTTAESKTQRTGFRPNDKSRRRLGEKDRPGRDRVEKRSEKRDESKKGKEEVTDKNTFGALADSSPERASRSEASNATDKDTTPKIPKEPSPLQSGWTFWFNKRDNKKGNQGAAWEEHLQQVGTFDKVELFWGYFNHMMAASQLEMNANYHLFRTGIKPAWEDPANAKGGKWIITTTSRDRHYLDAYWRNLVLAVIGEIVDDEEICGAVLSRRRGGDRLAVWNKSKDDADKILKLGAYIKQIVCEDVNPNPSFSMRYDYHEDSLKTGQNPFLSTGRFTINPDSASS